MKKAFFIFLIAVFTAAAFAKEKSKSEVENYITNHYDAEGFHIRMFALEEYVGLDFCKDPEYDTTVYRLEMDYPAPESKEFFNSLVKIIFQAAVTAYATGEKDFNGIVQPDEGWLDCGKQIWCDDVLLKEQNN